MAKKPSLKKQIKEAKKAAEELNTEVSTVEEYIKRNNLPAPDAEDEKLTAEEIFNFVDGFTNRSDASKSVNVNFDVACEKYVAVKNKHNETSKLIEEGKGYESQLKEKMRADPKELTDENFDEYYKIVSELHRLLGVEMALLNYRCAAGVVFLDQIKRAFPAECILN